MKTCTAARSRAAPGPLDDLLAALTDHPSVEPTGVPSEAPEAAPPAIVGAAILVVDDDPDVREMLEGLLAARGHHVRAAGDTGTALRMIVEAASDVVLLDINMPRLSGVEALPMIRAVAPSVAVIMVSGTVDAVLAKSALARGAFDYVAKPIDAAYLAQSLEAVLAMRELGP